MKYECAPLRKEDIAIKDWEFEGQQRGEQPILLCDFFSRSLNEYFVYYITGDKQPFSYLFTDSNKLNRLVQESDFYFNVLREQLSDPAFLQSMLSNTVDLPRKFNEEADREMERLTGTENISDSELAAYWQRLDEAFIKVIPWFWYPWFISKEDILTNRVKAGLEAYRHEIETLTDFEEGLLSVIFPIEKTGFQQEQEYMNDLVITSRKSESYRESPEFLEKADAYLKRFDWLTTFILTPVLPMSFEQLIARVEVARNENYEETFATQKADNRKKEELAEKIIALITDDTALMQAVTDARALAYGLTAGIEEAYIATSKNLYLLQMVAERMGIAFADTKYFLSKEIYQTLKGEMKLSDDELQERKQGFAMMMRGGKQYAAFGKPGHELSVWIDSELNTVDESIKEFKGQIACKGYATGAVQIALSPADAHTLREGEILVCPMTNPDYVPAMKRSAAIITDEGGLLSHAAIMSREFNKPCVIGTKIATKLLKDGDRVEVDANTGIVTILK